MEFTTRLFVSNVESAGVGVEIVESVGLGEIIELPLSSGCTVLLQAM